MQTMPCIKRHRGVVTDDHEYVDFQIAAQPENEVHVNG
jgi:hypothetical protein